MGLRADRRGGAPALSVAWKSGSGGTSPVIAGGVLLCIRPQWRARHLPAGRGRRLASLAGRQRPLEQPDRDGGRVILPVGNANDHATSGTLDVFHLPGH